MSLSYTLKESVSGFKRAKLSTFVSIVTLCISLLLLGIFGIVSINAARLIEAVKERMEIEVFLQEPVTRNDVATLQKQIESLEGVERVSFISKEEAAKIFEQEFGENINKVLDFNPLPPSFKLFLKNGYRTAGGAQTVADNIKAMNQVDEVVYRKALLEIIDRRTAAINNIALALGLLISISAILLVSNTIRLAIHAKRRVVRTMELVGATRSFIRSPFLLEGIIQGFFGGIIAAGMLYVAVEHLLKIASAELAAFVHMDPAYYFVVVAAGMLLGMIGAIISVTRFIRTEVPA